jgi:hypothetical protein
VDEAVNRYARELIDAINAAVARDPDVQACRDRARADGLELTLALEAVVGLAGRNEPAVGAGAATVRPARRPAPASRPYEITAADRRFLRSLRIAAADPAEDA